MGDRVVVEVTGYDASECAVLLYSHWGGSDAPAVVASALQVAPDRWGDASWAFDADDEVCGLVDGAAVSA